MNQNFDTATVHLLKEYKNTEDLRVKYDLTELILDKGLDAGKVGDFAQSEEILKNLLSLMSEHIPEQHQLARTKYALYTTIFHQRGFEDGKNFSLLKDSYNFFENKDDDVLYPNIVFDTAAYFSYELDKKGDKDTVALNLFSRAYEVSAKINGAHDEQTIRFLAAMGREAFRIDKDPDEFIWILEKFVEDALYSDFPKNDDIFIDSIWLLGFAYHNKFLDEGSQDFNLVEQRDSILRKYLELRQLNADSDFGWDEQDAFAHSIFSQSSRTKNSASSSGTGCATSLLFFTIFILALVIAI